MLSDHLTPAGFAKDLISEINENFQIENLMLVGHEPYLSDLVAILVAGDPSMSIAMKKGGLCCLSIDKLGYDKCATLEWLMTPAQRVWKLFSEKILLTDLATGISPKISLNSMQSVIEKPDKMG